jgi:putative ABC transport system permease protein
MFKNVIKVAIRKITKEFGYTFIIVLGLTIGIVSSLFLLLYVFDDLSYDQYHEKKDRIVRVISHITETDDEFTWGVAQIPFAHQAREDYPEIEEFARIYPFGRQLFIYDDVKLYDEDVHYADSSVFSIFSYDLMKGDPTTVLTRPNTMVVTESFANKYFGGEDPFGKTIEVGNGQSFEITGVMKDVPHNSHITFSALVSRTTLPADDEIGSWGNFGVYTYLLLAEGTDYMVLQDKMKEMYDKYMAEIFRQYDISIEYILEPLTDIYLKSDARGGTGRSGDIKYVYIFSIVAFFMLLIAIINYMNLATSRSTNRAKEVGLRKVVGSQRGSLILQFLSESVILTLIALIFSIVIIILLLPSFNQITGKLFDVNYLINTQIILTLLVIIIFVGIVGGSYPSFYLSRFNPVSVFKQEIGAGKSNFLIRKFLVVLQFAISLALIVNTWVIFKQLSYMKNKELGFDPDNVVIIELENQQMMRQYPVFRNALLESPDIINVSSSNGKIGQGTSKILMNVETSEGMQERGVNLYPVDYDFVETMGIEIIQGRDFSREFISDTTTGVIVNETMAKRFNWDDPLGKKLSFTGGTQDAEPYRVVGVMKDFYQLGLYSPIETLMFLLRENGYYANIKIKDQNIQETLQFIESKWSEVFPERPFHYTFLEDDYAQQFKADEKRGVIFTYFSILIILIASLGIFGLASFTVDQRTKEVGVRKVLGASVERIVLMINWEFLILILISMIPAFVGAYYYMKSWLQDYAYPVKIDPWMFIGTGLLAIIITLITVSYSTIRAGRINPADALRLE